MKQLSGIFKEKEDRLALIWYTNSEDKLILMDKMNDKSGRRSKQFKMLANAMRSDRKI